MKGQTEWILFPSITYANKARYYLGRAGIGSHMERIPETGKGKTCGYRLEVQQTDWERALDICRNNGIRMSEAQEGTTQ